MNIIKRIDNIIPFDLVLLSNMPIVVACFINFPLVDFRYIVINMVWLMLFSIPSCAFRTNVFNKISSLIFFLIGSVEMLHWMMVKSPITVANILTLAATHWDEGLDFLSFKGSLSLLLMIPYTLLFIYSFRRKRNYKDKPCRYITIILASLFVIGFISENALNQRLIRKGVPYFVKVCFSFSSQYNFYKQTEQAKLKSVTAKVQSPNNQTFVLIIGESLNRHHMSLYGYHRNTNPKLSKRNDLIIYKDVVSGYSNTISAVLSILSESNLENKKNPELSLDIFDVFSSAGFSTFWLSNQIPYGIWENKVTTLAKKAERYTFVNQSSSSSMEATLTASFDEKLFSALTQALKSEVRKKLIVLHLMGNHTSYKKRYPRWCNRFSGNTKQEQTIAEYDNSVLYNDYVTDSLLNIINVYTNKDIASVIYLSDHAENVYDEDGQLGHAYSGKLPRSNVDIPFMVWLSDEFKRHYPNKTNLIQKHQNKPYVSDDLFHSVLDINGIETPCFQPKRSLFNVEFNHQRPRVLVDNQDYDQK